MNQNYDWNDLYCHQIAHCTSYLISCYYYASILQNFQELTIKSLSLLWDLFHDERLPVEMVDAALEAHFNVIESAIPAEELRRHYIERCIDELLLDSGNLFKIMK